MSYYRILFLWNVKIMNLIFLECHNTVPHRATHGAKIYMAGRDIQSSDDNYSARGSLCRSACK